MHPILDPDCRPVLEHFRSPRTLMAFDYDGTLAPIVADPASAQMRAGTRELLKRVAQRWPTVVITGRARRDVQRFLVGVPLLEVIGNHGFESFGVPPPSSTRQVAAWRAVLQPLLSGLPGVWLEDKRLSLAIHYRQAADVSRAAQGIQAALAAIGPVRLVGGKAVVNVLPAEAPHKGDALLRLCERLGCRRAVYVGDDDTDEDVFDLRQPERILSIRVGADRRSAAMYFLREQAEIDALLEALAGEAAATA